MIYEIAKPEGGYVSDTIRLRRAWITEPEIAQERALAAKGWKKLRAENPKLAAVLFRHIKRAERKTRDDMAREIFTGVLPLV